MTIRSHIEELRELREAYSRMLETLVSGKLMVGSDQSAHQARIDDTRRKIAEFDAVIDAEVSRRAQGS